VHMHDRVVVDIASARRRPCEPADEGQARGLGPDRRVRTSRLVEVATLTPPMALMLAFRGRRPRGRGM